MLVRIAIRCPHFHSIFGKGRVISSTARVRTWPALQPTTTVGVGQLGQSTGTWGSRSRSRVHCCSKCVTASTAAPQRRRAAHAPALLESTTCRWYLTLEPIAAVQPAFMLLSSTGASCTAVSTTPQTNLYTRALHLPYAYRSSFVSLFCMN